MKFNLIIFFSLPNFQIMLHIFICHFIFFLSWKEMNPSLHTIGVWFVLTDCWACGLPWYVVDILNITPLKETDFPFSSSYEFLARTGNCDHFPSSMLLICETWAYTRHMHSVSLSESLCSCVVSEKCYLGEVLFYPCLESFCLLFHIVFWALRGRMWYRHPL